MEQENLSSYEQYPTYSSETTCTKSEISEESRALAGNAKTICSSTNSAFPIPIMESMKDPGRFRERERERERFAI
jgi:hypothetical protein